MINTSRAARFALLAAVTSYVVLPSIASADEPKRFVATSMQDEKEQVPVENLAWFSSTKRKKRMRIALREQAGAPAEQLANLKATLIDQDLEKREFPVDESGFVTIDDVKPGAHAVVVTGDDVHSATMVVFKEQPDEADPSIEQPVEMSAMSIPNEQLLSLVDNYLGSGGSQREVDASVYNDDVEATFNQSEPFDYQVRLSQEGTLAGQVLTVMRPGSPESDVADTNIVLLQNGKPIARAVTDATGQFFFDGVRPGVHGLIAAGRGGYAAFAFEAVGAESLVSGERSSENRQFVTKAMAVADVLPVLLIPTPMVPTVVEIIEEEYIEVVDVIEVPLDDFGGIPMSGSVPTGYGPGGAVGASSSVGAGGGFGGLAALGFLGAGAAGSGSGGSTPPAVSPTRPSSTGEGEVEPF